jgi:hypothetical protein
MNRSSVVCLGLATLAIIVCAGRGEFNEAVDRDRLLRMEQEILSFIGESSCSDSTECRYIAFGDKPCGGPWKYLIYSASEVDSVDLIRRVTAYNRFNKDLNHRYGWMSDCSVPIPPNLGCSDGLCVDQGN